MKLDKDGTTLWEIVYVSVFNGRTITERYHNMDDVRQVYRRCKLDGSKIIKADC